MITDRLNDNLLGLGYKRMDSNNPGLYLYYLPEASKLTIISIIHTEKGDELTPTHYKQLLDKEKESLGNTYPGEIKLLSLLLTRNPDSAKHLFTDNNQDSHWIVDVDLRRLMLFETQMNDFATIRDILEQILTEETGQILSEETGQKLSEETGEKLTEKTGEKLPEETGQLRNPVKAVSPFTLINTTIIVINILAFLIVQYTPLFGGGDRAFINGASSWYYILEGKQYYRLITSMFMHVDISHLMNNMVVMLFIGSILERAIGSFKFPLIYFGAGILAGLASIGYNMWKENASFVFGNSVMAIGASGAIFGLIGAVLYIVVANRGRLEQIGTRQMIIFVVLSLYSGIINPQTDSASHIGGFFAGMLLALILYRRPQSKADSRRDSQV